ncbi:MAG: hypothetical protein AB1813_28620, partial [Verrucomicrobiota bacterium]
MCNCRLTNQVDALNRGTKFEYDGFGRRIRRDVPGGQKETFGYDATGNLLSHTNFLGIVITNFYDLVCLLARWNAGVSLVSYGYSTAGRRLAMTNTAGVHRYIYDPLGRLCTNTTPVGT